MTNATAALLVLVIALASATAYFGYQTVVSSGSKSTGTGGAATLADSITVDGAGAISYIPNEALVHASVVTENQTAEVATSSNAMMTLAVIKALNGAGISNSSIETQGYDLSVNYANCFDSSGCIPRITGYTVTNNLQVNYTSTSPSQLGFEAGLVIDTAVGAGANQITLSFSETNSVLATLTNSALQQALATASSQAKVIASSLGVSITGVISASNVPTSTPCCVGTPELSAAAASPASTPILPGSESLSVSVQVVYAIS